MIHVCRARGAFTSFGLSSPGRKLPTSTKFSYLSSKSHQLDSSKCKAIGIYFGTTSGSTEAAADVIKDVMVSPYIYIWVTGSSSPKLTWTHSLFLTLHFLFSTQPGTVGEIVDISSADITDFSGFDGLIVGAPTWNTGADDMRSMTDWDDKLDDIRELNLDGKPVAVFGLGDSCGYGEYFCDAIEELHDAFAAAGANMIGYTSPEGYDFTDSKALREGKFLGLPLDATNEDDLTEGRVKKWTEQLVTEGMKSAWQKIFGLAESFAEILVYGKFNQSAGIHFFSQ